MHLPKVSLIMSVYNDGQFLGQAIRSVLDQSFKDFEFIIVNDGSTIEISRILAEFASADPRIIIVTNSENIGLTKSLNKALQLCRGEYIARMDADDISLPQRLQKQVDFLENNKNIGVLGTGVKIIDNSGNITKVPKLPEGDFENFLHKKNIFVHGSLMFRKQSLDLVGNYNDNMRLAQDYELLLRLSGKVAISCLPECLYLLRRHGKSISCVKCFSQIYYTTLAKKFFFKWEGIKGKLLFIKEFLYCYVVIYKLALPSILRTYELIK